MREADRQYYEANPPTPPPVDEWDNEAVRALKDQGLV